MDAQVTRTENQTPAKARGPRAGLSLKLLILTILFVLLAEILIFVPSVANYRKNWLEDRLAAAQVAVLVLEAAPREGLPPGLEAQLLEGVGAQAIAARAGGARRLLALETVPPDVGRTVDLRNPEWSTLIRDAFDVMLDGAKPAIRVIGRSKGEADFVEMIISEEPLRASMLGFARNILWLSLFIAGMTAALVYLALHLIIVRPVKRLAGNVMAFEQDPDNPTLIARPTGRTDEIGEAEEALSRMERTLAGSLRERRRLAAVGLAVSKINHDLRNMLASAQLLSDRIGESRDPSVQRFGPKLIATLNRAIAFCESTLSYGRVTEPVPDKRPVDIAALSREVADLLTLGEPGRPAFRNDGSTDLTVACDPDQMFRVLSNLMRNADQALSQHGTADGAPPFISVSVTREDQHAVIRVADNGPGVPERAQAALFEAFKGSVSAGGTGLGLAIAAELVQLHGGDIMLEDSAVGAVFRISLPLNPPAAG